MKKRTKEEWEVLFTAQEQSGLSVAAFCREQGLCNKYFGLRRKQLGWQVSQRCNVFSEVTIETSESLIPMTSMVLRTGDSQLCFEILPDTKWLADLIRQLS